MVHFENNTDCLAKRGLDRISAKLVFITPWISATKAESYGQNHNCWWYYDSSSKWPFASLIVGLIVFIVNNRFRLSMIIISLIIVSIVVIARVIIIAAVICNLDVLSRELW